MHIAQLQITLVVLGIACLFFHGSSRYASTVYFISAAVLGLFRVFREPYGWDSGLYCNAGEAIRKGLDPYILEQMSRISDMGWTFVYPAATAFLFRPLCYQEKILFPVFYMILMLVVFALFRPRRLDDSLYFLAILTAGFLGFHWNFKTGNIGVVELFLLAFFIWFFRRSSFTAMGVCLGAMSVFKILPLLYAPIVLLTDKGQERKNQKAFFLATGATFAGINILSLILLPGLFPSYVRQVLGFIPGQESPIREYIYADPTNPTFFMAVRSWAIKIVGGYGTWIILVGLLLYLFYRMFQDVSRWRISEPVKVLSFGILLVSLSMPRFKPYALVLTTLPLYLVTVDYPWKWRSGILFLSCALPFLAFLEVIRPVGVFFVFMWTYQTTCLLLTITLIYIFEKLQATEGEG